MGGGVALIAKLHHPVTPSSSIFFSPPTITTGFVYRGRFAPSPTGALHLGSLLAALASHQHARAHGGAWIVRIEDVDTARAQDGMAQTILQQLANYDLHSDETVVYQSQRGALYEHALEQLIAAGLAYPCTCSRKTIQQTLIAQGVSPERHRAAVYPGTCREKTNTNTLRHAWRLNTSKALGWLQHRSTLSQTPNSAQYAIKGATIHWHDARLGAQSQNIVETVGDFVLKRADGCYSYQLAVVVDDADQGITHVVRGEDLADNTPRQILLQRLLGLPPVHYLHTPLILASNGEKLSKQNGAEAIQAKDKSAHLAHCRSVLEQQMPGSDPETVARFPTQTPQSDYAAPSATPVLPIK